MESQLKNRIMRRVYFIYAVKAVGRPIIAKSVVLLGFLAAASVFVSVQSVIANMASARSVPALYHFFVSAFANAEVSVQLLSVATFAVLLFLARDVVGNTFSGRTLSEARV